MTMVRAFSYTAVLGETLKVSGTGNSAMIHVAVIQVRDGQVHRAQTTVTTAPDAEEWSGELPAAGYVAGQATAVATSIDLVDQDGWPGFETRTCAQTITVMDPLEQGELPSDWAPAMA